MEGWTFLTNHGHVLVCIASDPEVLLKDVATRVGITERAAQRIAADLIAEGYLTATKLGRRNRYKVNGALPFRHPLERSSAVGSLLSLLKAGRKRGAGVQSANLDYRA